MPKGPQDQNRPADAIARAVMVGRIATGEIDEVPIEARGSVGGRARAEALSSAKRSEIARLGAERRWQGKGTRDMTTAVKETVAHGREAVRMYPNNQLGPQVRKLSDAFSGFEMLRQELKKA